MILNKNFRHKNMFYVCYIPYFCRQSALSLEKGMFAVRSKEKFQLDNFAGLARLLNNSITA